jgi:hypothetical protein
MGGGVMIGKKVYGYWGAGIEPTVAKVTGYTKTKDGDIYFAAKEIETNEVYYLYDSDIKKGPMPSYGPINELGGWYYKGAA